MAVNLPEYGIDGFQIPTARTPDKNALLEAILNKQTSEVKKFRQNANQYSDQLYNQYQKQVRQNLSDTQKQTKESYAARGLLNSGISQGSQAKNKVGALADLSAQREAINRGLENNYNQMFSNASNLAYGMAGLAPQLSSSILGDAQNSVNSDISNMRSMNYITGGLLGGAGKLAGSYVGSMQPTQSPQQFNYSNNLYQPISTGYTSKYFGNIGGR